MDRAIRQQAEEVAGLLIQGEPANPWHVTIDLNAAESPSRPIELHLGIPILIFELQQLEITVTKDNVVEFVTNDIKDHRQKALNGYLTIVRYVVAPPPRRKNVGWFPRMFTSPPQWTPPPARWIWSRISGISLSNDEALLITGHCQDAATHREVTTP